MSSLFPHPEFRPPSTAAASPTPHSKPEPRPRRKASDIGPDERIVITFGKHRGKTLGELDAGYLKWLIRKCDNLDPDIRLSVGRILRYRRKAANAAETAMAPEDRPSTSCAVNLPNKLPEFGEFVPVQETKANLLYLRDELYRTLASADEEGVVPPMLRARLQNHLHAMMHVSGLLLYRLSWVQPETPSPSLQENGD